MGTIELREKLTAYIQNADEQQLKALYEIVTQENDTDIHRLNLVRAERQKYLRGEGDSLTWESVKAAALNKTVITPQKLTHIPN